MKYKVILASGSPRRKELLEKAGVSFVVRTADVDESLDEALMACPEESCRVLAVRKAQAVVQLLMAEKTEQPFVVLGSDTMVVCDGEIFGKPENNDHAHSMLSRLAGRTHQVMTSVALLVVEEDVASTCSFVDISEVTFKALTSADIYEYLAVGESFDKAGAYAIQSEGARLVSGVEGSMDTVIGLPAERLMREYADILR